MEPNTPLDIESESEKILSLLENKRYAELRRELCTLEPIDIAEMIETLPKDKLLLIFRILPKDVAADVFVEFSPETEEILINSVTDHEIAEMLEELYVDDAVDVIEEMPANVVERLLKNASPDTRKTVNEILKYPENSAGSIMTTEYVRLSAQMTVEQALEHIRRVAIEKETIYTCYVLEKRVLTGIVSAKDLLISPLDKKIGEIMETNWISVSAYDDREDAAQMFARYNYLALPVVDKENRMVGIITFDDVIDVIQEETEEDFAKMAAITPGDEPYLKSSVWDIWKKRIPWLLLLMISATFTGIIITSFEQALAASIALTSFIPMLMDTGGNSGSQASVTVIRGLSLGEIEFSDIFKIMWKEFRISLLCGVSLACATFVKILVFDNWIMHSNVSPLVALVVCITLCLTVICAKLIGCTLPVLAKKIKLDPAVMASPFITTLVDAISLLIYFKIAQMLLKI